ncbi:MAG: hypothetical protein ACP5VS_02125 [Desulfomonilaceae bacterium]
MSSKVVTFRQKNVNILFMISGLSVPTLVGAIVAISSFIAAMFSLMNENFLESGYRIVWVSLVIGPIAMASSMLGYSAWWFTKFLIAIGSNQNGSGPAKINYPPDK